MYCDLSRHLHIHLFQTKLHFSLFFWCLGGNFDDQYWSVGVLFASFLIQALLTSLIEVCGNNFIYKFVYVSWSHYFCLNLVSSNQAGILVLTVTRKRINKFKSQKSGSEFSFLTSNCCEKFVTHTNVTNYAMFIWAVYSCIYKFSVI